MRRADILTTFKCRLSWNLEASTSWNSQGLSRPVMELLYLYCTETQKYLLWAERRISGLYSCLVAGLCRITNKFQRVKRSKSVINTGETYFRVAASVEIMWNRAYSPLRTKLNDGELKNSRKQIRSESGQSSSLFLSRKYFEVLKEERL